MHRDIVIACTLLSYTIKKLSIGKDTIQYKILTRMKFSANPFLTSRCQSAQNHFDARRKKS